MSLENFGINPQNKKYEDSANEVAKNTQPNTATPVKDITQNDLPAVKASIEDNSKLVEENALKIENQYASQTGRLVNFKYSNGNDDDKHRAYFMLKADSNIVNEVTKNIDSEGDIVSIFQTLVGDSSGYKFKAFILTGISENRQEKQSILPILGDNFIATFTGGEPQVLDISGLLPFDSDTSRSSWFINFMQAYTHLFRASKLAIYKMTMKIVLPDLSTYTIYPISINANITSGQDTIIPFHLGCIVTNNKLVKAYGISQTAQTLTDEEKAEQKTVDAQTNGTSISPKEVGDDSAKKTNKMCARDYIAACMTGEGGNEGTKGINKAIQGVLALKGLSDSGAFNFITKKAYGHR